MAIGFQIYDTEIKAQYVLTKEDSNTDIASNVEDSNHQQEEIKNLYPIQKQD